jgi:nitrate reductase NapAB chaperone NapD
MDETCRYHGKLVVLFEVLLNVAYLEQEMESLQGVNNVDGVVVCVFLEVALGDLTDEARE